ncbi:MAG: hydrogenase small subunit [Eggerthellaceae bacterium]|nr:hydrogenase small subunit [Eggerthellaceae bacterium]
MSITNAGSQLGDLLETRGVSRRSFLQMCTSIAIATGLGISGTERVANALEESVIGKAEGNLVPVIWIEGASCTGCTEAFAGSSDPDPASIVLELISLNYNETLNAAAGHSVELARHQTIEQCAGKYVLVYEGGISTGWGGNGLRAGGETGIQILTETAANAAAVIALGSCAVNGGWMAAHPNPGSHIGVQQCLEDNGVSTPVVNLPGCPGNPEHLVAVIVSYILLGTLPELDGNGMPVSMFGQTIHDNCERRGHFENGEFVREWGSVEEAKGYCLYAMGCRGPQTKDNCGVVRWNRGQNWCIASGAPCIGCATADPHDTTMNWVDQNTPFYKRHRDVHIAGAAVQPAVAAGAVTGLVALALAVHGFGMKKTGRAPHGADFEKAREWDIKNPDKSIGQYDDGVLENAASTTKSKGDN